MMFLLVFALPVCAGDWSGPIPISILQCGSGSIQSQNGYISPNGIELIQGYWRENQGWKLTVPIVGGIIQWNSVGDWSWSGPISISKLPGSGDIMAQDGFFLPNSGDLLQRFWRGNQCYWRVVPVSNGNIVWSNASDWFGPIPISILPGSGNMQCMTAYMLPNGDDMKESFWRNNQGYARTLKLKDSDGFILNPSGTSYLEWIFDSYDWTFGCGSSLHLGDDYHAYDWKKNDGNTEGQNAYAMAPGIVIYARSSPPDWAYGKQVVVQFSV